VRPPAGSLHVNAFVSQSVAFAAVLGLGMWAREGLRLGDAYPIKAAGAFGLVMVLTLGHLRDGHPFSRFGAANQVTTARAAIVALIAGLIGEAGPPMVAGSAAVASLVVTLLDGVDGWLARRARTASAFGARFDMEIDAVLIQALSILAWQYGKAGPWVIASGLLRYLFVAAGWIWSWMQRPLPPTDRGRIICVIQIVALIVALVPPVTPPTSTAIAALALFILGYSFLVDTLWLWRHAEIAGPIRSRTP
jgi:phosphatidylglycerophosphate synthase